jgi:3-methyladenine DNA glycosylase/8-oxoguanine DNA glycosylase
MPVGERELTTGEFIALVRQQQVGRFDPTLHVDGNTVWWAQRTPDGPATLELRCQGGPVEVAEYGPGGHWLAERVPGLLGDHDTPESLVPFHPVVAEAMRKVPVPRIGRSSVVMGPLIAAILSQRITSQEAVGQWSALCRFTGTRAPGPREDLLLPPDPAILSATPYFSLHPLGIERRRADTVRQACSHAIKLQAALDGALATGSNGPDAEELRRMLDLIPGVGVYTVAITMGSALGDPDALAVGDYHLKNIVAYAFSGRSRGTDDEMVSTLAPYAGQRARVVSLLQAAGWSAPKFGPRRAIAPIASW